MSRLYELVELLRGHTSLDIVCHDSPDPDNIASAAAIEWIAENRGFGRPDPLRRDDLPQQNRAMVEQFGLKLVAVTSTTVTGTALIAFVDHALPGDHTQLPPGTDVDIVIDHHQYNKPVHARFVYLRPSFGATSTILTEYLTEISNPPPVYLASMLLFALHRERLDHVRNPTHFAYDAATLLQRHASQSMIYEFYSAQFSPARINAIEDAIKNRRVRGRSLVSWVGHVAVRDALPQAANILINLKGTDNTFVYGISDGEIHLSARSQNPALQLNRVLREVVGSQSRAGGHEDMAGG
ncbi:DHH family phosphoesterase [Salinigranum marinum]|uniref:DHH family phosphoesterase n=1 Tax=Salinigranum marinum TaxID=1515595 RepID=UPI002989AE95|nr:DHH family phosphoesterase [Salinigranum marinum]